MIHPIIADLKKDSNGTLPVRVVTAALKKMDQLVNQEDFIEEPMIIQDSNKTFRMQRI